jgi:tRNA A37 threonylcarbamoyladenosine dehydratase
VGSYACEALARSGIGALTLIDKDTVAPSNINRQLYALTETIGKEKTMIARERIAAINPNCRVRTFTAFLDENNVAELIPEKCDYIIDGD